MYLGIDLGTSNSAIVGNDAGLLKHFKTVDGKDVLPSSIMIDKRGGMLVGQRAYEQAAFSPENVAQGFKRLMGTSSVITFASTGRTMNPEEASTEILKALISQAKMTAGDFGIEGAVVTIPAAFNQMQTEATMRAATAAGLDRVALLQEPIAAALASIATSTNKNGQFLVYDLGGGTFDVAIVQAVAASATVISHAGINMLGGRDFDRALLNSVVRPWLLDNFDLPDNFQTEKKYQRLVRVAQYRAEIAKIALSTQMTDRVFADESQIGAVDGQGQEIYLDVEVTREQLEALIRDDIDRSIELCRKLLQDSGYTHNDIDRVVMIGGPSRMPLVRERIGHDLGIRVDLATDPMTAVAFGAAIFAESRDWSGEASTLKSLRGKKEVKGPIEAQYDFPARTSDERARIRIKLGGHYPGCRIQASTEDGWTTGQIPVEGLSEIKDIPLTQSGENRINITFFDAQGVARPDASTVLSLFRSSASSAGMPMPHNLAVKIAAGAFGAERNALELLVEKGMLLPTSGSKRFRAARDLHAGDGTHLDFEVYQQTEGVDDPELNLPVGTIRISSSDLEKGDVIRRGDEVFVGYEVDENGLLKCELQVPSISKTYSGDKMYISAIGHKNFGEADGVTFASNALSDAQEDVAHLERALGERVSDLVSKLRARLVRLKQELSLSDEADTRRSVSEEARLIRQEVAIARSRPEFVRSSIRSEIASFVEDLAETFATSINPETSSKIVRLTSLARDVLNSESPKAPEESARYLADAKALLFRDLAKIPDFWIGRLDYLSDQRHLAVDKDLHDHLVSEGFAAVQKSDIDEVRDITFRLHENLIRVADPTRAGKLSGLMRD